MIDTWTGTVYRKRSRVSKDDVDLTMAEDSDPYDFTEDENSQIFITCQHEYNCCVHFILHFYI